MSSLNVRTANRGDLEEFSGKVAGPTVRAWVLEDGGSVIALFGLAFIQGRWFVFSDLKPEVRKYKVTIVRLGKWLMEKIGQMNIRFVYAEINPNEPLAEKWLTSLGFEPDARGDSLMRWSA